MSATMGAVFKHVARDPIRSKNSLVIASDVPLSAPTRSAPRRCPASCETLAERERRAARAGRCAAASVFTDDRAPVEWLIDTSIVEYAAGDGADEAQPAGASSRACCSSPASRRSAPRSRRRGWSRPRSAPRRSCGRTRSRSCWSRWRAATGSAGGSPTATRTPRDGARGAARRGADRADPAAGDPAAGRHRGLARASSPARCSCCSLLVAPPVLVLGALSPWAIRLRVQQRRRARAT